MLASQASHGEIAIPAWKDGHVTSHTLSTHEAQACAWDFKPPLMSNQWGGGTVAWAWSRTSRACNGSGFGQAGWRFDGRKVGCQTSLAALTPPAWAEREERCKATVLVDGTTSTKAQHHYTSCSSPNCSVSATKPVGQPAIPVLQPNLL